MAATASTSRVRRWPGLDPKSIPARRGVIRSESRCSNRPGMMEIRTSHQADREIIQCTKPRWSMAQLYQERTADLE